MIEDMPLAGLAEGTQKIYIQAVRRLAAHYRRSPNELGEEEVRGYLLELRQRGVGGGAEFSIQRVNFSPNGVRTVSIFAPTCAIGFLPIVEVWT
jgi:hypothetical protein